MTNLLPVQLEKLQQFADRPALTDGQQTLSYQQLAVTITELAKWLQQFSAQRFAINGPNSLSWIIADLALALSDKICVPVPRFFSTAQQAYILETAGIEVILDTEPLSDNIPAPLAGLWYRLRVPAKQHSLPQFPMQSGKVTFTSGTTGKPKGVCLSWSQQAATLAGLAQALSAEFSAARHPQQLRHYCLLPLSTLLENQAGVYLPLALGQQIIVLNEQQSGLSGSSKLDLPQLAQSLGQFQPNSMILTPQLLQALIMICQQQPTIAAHFQFIAVGGAHCAPQLLAQAAELGLPVYQGYGLSEAGSVVALNLPGANRASAVGKALPHVQLRVNEGHIEVKGQLFAGYLGDTPRNADSWLDTGDLGQLDSDGYLSIAGRSKQLIISSFGRNISPEWLEAELQLCPAIAQVMVCGDAKPWLSALIMPRQPNNVNALKAQLQALNSRLPDYAQIRMALLLKEPFSSQNQQLTDNGRLRRQHILAQYQPQLDQLYHLYQPKAEPVLVELNEEYRDELLSAIN
jgi:long-subunit acyl-CoA synthetase (AMP-forming)